MWFLGSRLSRRLSIQTSRNAQLASECARLKALVERGLSAKPNDDSSSIISELRDELGALQTRLSDQQEEYEKLVEVQRLTEEASQLRVHIERGVEEKLEQEHKKLVDDLKAMISAKDAELETYKSKLDEVQAQGSSDIGNGDDILAIKELLDEKTSNLERAKAELNELRNVRF